jgi:hypothetical protein
MINDDYKKYSLENLSKWVNDAISSSGATPEEIYNTIKEVVEEEHTHHQEGLKKSSDLLSLLNGSTFTINDVLRERDYYETSSPFTFSSCSPDDTSPECMTSWSDFWSNDYTDEQSVKVDGYSVDGVSHSKYWYDYDRNDPNRKNPFEDRVVKWQLPVGVDGLTGDCYVNLPDDLLERAGLKEGDTIEWIDRQDGSFELRKVNGTK